MYRWIKKLKMKTFSWWVFNTVTNILVAWTIAGKDTYRRISNMILEASG